MPRPPTTLFEDAIDVPLWLEADRDTPYAERSRRDREIGRAIAARSRAARVREWWRKVGPSDAATIGVRLARGRTLVTLLVTALGLVAGVGAALAGFAYDGAQPVNVVRLLALLVGLQLVLLAVTLLLLAARAAGLRRLQDLLGTLNVGAFALAIFRRIARPPPELERWFDWHTARGSAGRFAKWQLLAWSQTAAVSFNVAAIATAIVLVTFTDLAFGWSTTLDANPAIVSRAARAIAWPWHTLVPDAVPSEALVEQSQFFRLRGAADLPAGARALTGWWPFTILAIVTYGLAPRLALLALAIVRLRAAVAALLLEDARVTALLDRMESPGIETAALGHDEAPGPSAAPRRSAHGRVGGTANAVIWEGSLAKAAAHEYARTRLGLELGAVAEAGGERALGADARALEEVASADARTIVIFTPAWEPPLLELLDFVEALRRRVGDDASIVVAPVPDGARAVTEVERATWTTALGRIADPRVYVETGA